MLKFLALGALSLLLAGCTVYGTDSYSDCGYAYGNECPYYGSYYGPVFYGHVGGPGFGGHFGGHGHMGGRP